MEQKRSNLQQEEEESFSGGGVPVHSQVRKIRQEMEKIKHPSLQQPEMMRPVFRDITGRQRSRSPLGLAERPIAVGN
nr:Urease accessory protein like [Ipomoea batatas]